MRRRIWQVIDSLDAEILRFTQNDIEGHFFSNLLGAHVFQDEYSGVGAQIGQELDDRVLPLG